MWKNISLERWYCSAVIWGTVEVCTFLLLSNCDTTNGNCSTYITIVIFINCGIYGYKDTFCFIFTQLRDGKIRVYVNFKPSTMSLIIMQLFIIIHCKCDFLQMVFNWQPQDAKAFINHYKFYYVPTSSSFHLFSSLFKKSGILIIVFFL